MSTKSKSVNKKSAKKSLFTITELSTFQHQAIKVISQDGEILIKKDSIIAMREIEESGEKFCLLLCVAGSPVKIKGTYQEVAAKLNWTIED